ncbi:hypothetical protein BZA70DRAFT_10054 [Myxozyma melibiosi]|uniref:Uncharacterized protein n=1 Tax=Myxozyma melibiosi TaxID=54550 RepID=A0ABR1FC46_9ASCO
MNLLPASRVLSRSRIRLGCCSRKVSLQLRRRFVPRATAGSPEASLLGRLAVAGIVFITHSLFLVHGCFFLLGSQRYIGHTVPCRPVTDLSIPSHILLFTRSSFFSHKRSSLASLLPVHAFIGVVWTRRDCSIRPPLTRSTRLHHELCLHRWTRIYASTTGALPPVRLHCRSRPSPASGIPRSSRRTSRRGYGAIHTRAPAAAFTPSRRARRWGYTATVVLDRRRVGCSGGGRIMQRTRVMCLRRTAEIG